MAGEQVSVSVADISRSGVDESQKNLEVGLPLVAQNCKGSTCFIERTTVTVIMAFQTPPTLFETAADRAWLLAMDDRTFIVVEG
ncbi:uncharacterized protein PADG_00516 [Paracoccidioides brasiliensis Pb18]|uniref:Uncharacterized protein n=1 Tax=Paracoccidioides brasiliensis (strain Pb18) TaxID=502780 RepID=C1G0X6_PARBD|nr:uncharacterized protein PADG_00516 [Paracoccidioides brasiliensis Pb18]EEH44227.2 hypothetical protein PADG_00516 [Paracoccidioides brasiliensis Pb18]ODH53399.1 hypothetical protein GX48_00229 [Paracoccidioides brasiliensis]